MDYQKRLRYIYSFIPKTNMEKFPGEFGIKRVKLLLSKVGNPQNIIPIIHIAGTSGKGSTATITARILEKHGFRTGLHMKPHIFDLRERFQINNSLISEDMFVKYADELFSYVPEVNSAGYGALTYFEVLICMAYFVFAKEKCEVAVVETGVGGLFDGSNVVDTTSKICVLTRIGFDHMQILGNTLQEIALQKAGIIQNQNAVITIDQGPEINNVFEIAAKEKKTSVKYVDVPTMYGDNVDFVFKQAKLRGLHVALKGDYQIENTVLALAASELFLERSHSSLDPSITSDVLDTISIPARFDVKNIFGKIVILDGAHNIQKMKAFLQGLKESFPNQKFEFLVSFKEGKEIDGMLDLIIPLAHKIIITDFFTNEVDFVSLSADLHGIAESLKEKKFENVEIVYSAASSIEDLIAKSSATFVVTGSLYMLSDVYKHLKELKA